MNQQHTCITDDGGNPNRSCQACINEHELEGSTLKFIESLWRDMCQIRLVVDQTLSHYENPMSLGSTVDRVATLAAISSFRHDELVRLQKENDQLREELNLWQHCANCHEKMNAPGHCSRAESESEAGYRIMLEQCHDELDVLRERAERAEERLDEELEHLKDVEAAGWCDVCTGTGHLSSGKACMCGGTGLASMQVTYLRERLDEAEAERDQLRGIRPELPPRPPEGTWGMRYGIRWNGPSVPLAVPMEDGYWTPWHIANEALEQMQEKLIQRARTSQFHKSNHLAAEALLTQAQEKLRNRAIILRQFQAHKECRDDVKGDGAAVCRDEAEWIDGLLVVINKD